MYTMISYIKLISIKYALIRVDNHSTLTLVKWREKICCNKKEMFQFSMTEIFHNKLSKLES